MKNVPVFRYYPLEERLNIWSHGLGVVAALIGTVLLFAKMTLHTPKAYFAVGVYAFSLLFLYTASTLYHRAKREELREKLRVVDHMAIYVLIAGTYTPFTLLALPPKLGVFFFGLTWTLAIIGMVLKVFYTGKWDKLSTVMYVLMGWCIVFALFPLIEAISLTGFWWLLAGGIVYSLGAVLYLFENIRYMHFTFHLFVLLGSVLHFVAVYFFVIS